MSQLVILDALPFPAMLINLEGRIVRANPETVRLFGRDGTGMHYITALRQPVVLDAVEAILQDHQSRSARYLSREGDKDTTWSVTLRELEFDDETMVLLIMEDISALEAASQMRRDFVANVSHELRTPLTSLMGFIETLRGAARDDEAARDRFLAIMEQEAGRMARMIEDLLSLNRVEQDERVRPRDEVDLEALIEETIRMLTPHAQNNGVELSWSTDADGAVVIADPVQLRQVLTNLIENGIKYGQSGGRVVVHLSAPRQEPALRGPGIQISVRDFGEGIAAHHIPRLTERFYRVDSHRSRQIGGTGLGLAIVKHVINRHRGRIRVESVLGQGAKFIVVLPLTQG